MKSCGWFWQLLNKRRRLSIICEDIFAKSVDLFMKNEEKYMDMWDINNAKSSCLDKIKSEWILIF